jgi:hypothetical protein
LPDHLLGLTLHFQRGDIVAGDRGENAPAGSAGTEKVGVAEARHQRDHHEYANDGQQAAKNHLLDRPRGL